jgi:hypothetical protein
VLVAVVLAPAAGTKGFDALAIVGADGRSTRVSAPSGSR